MKLALKVTVEFRLVSSLVLTLFRQTQKLLNPLLRHNQSPPPLHHHRIEPLSRLRPNADERADHENVPFGERRILSVAVRYNLPTCGVTPRYLIVCQILIKFNFTVSCLCSFGKQSNNK